MNQLIQLLEKSSQKMPSQLILMYINVEAKDAKFEVSEKVDVGEIQTSFIDCKSVIENNSLWFEMVEQKFWWTQTVMENGEDQEIFPSVMKYEADLQGWLTRGYWA